ncbi:MAG: PAS domain S-box protein [Anaerolineales bacterium]|nr:PAS domain S-box protein [Anaerolineales bacterium]MCB9145349.1 PAS domain S-box protein [Anaerolineales bacterium]
MKKNLDQAQPSSEDWQYHDIFDSVHDGIIVSDFDTGLVVEANLAACKMHGYAHEAFIGLPLIQIIHPDSQLEFNEFVRAFHSGGAFDIRTLHVRRDGTTFHAEWRVTQFEYQNRPCLLGIVRDVSKQMQAEQGLSQRAETRLHEQATLLEISHTLASTLELQPGLILDQLREIIEYDQAGLFSLENSTFITLAMRGANPLEQSTPIRIRFNDPETLRTFFNEHRPTRIANVWSDEPQARFLRSLLEDGAFVLLEGMNSWMWVPLAVKSRVIGGMGVAHKKPDFFTPHHADLALSVANQAAITMINAELYGHAQELAVLEERQRLARDLHDAVNQSLFSAGLIAEVLPRLWDRDPEEARGSLEDLRRLTRGAMAEMRALLAELRPSTLTDAELGDLLRLLGNSFTGRTDIPVKIMVEGQGMLPAEVQVAIYRVGQEALNNVTKHAEARSVEIVLKQDKSSIELIIRDDGKGFASEQIASGHYGLSMMRERAEAVGAQLSITSQPGKGTELTIRWRELEKKEVS